MRSSHHIYRKGSPLVIILIMLTVFGCFFSTINNGFVWDDEYNLLDNPAYKGLSWRHLSWMFTTFHGGNYHPLSWITLGLDYTLWGMNPAGYHFTNLVLHGLNAVLFYLLLTDILRRSYEDDMTLSFNFLVSALIGTLFFAVHPLRVESVAWISTRGDTLCGIFYLLTILFYFRIGKKAIDAETSKWYWLSLIFYGCSLLSRAWGITLPIILLILDIYPLRRWTWKKNLWQSNKTILVEKIPFAFLSLVAGLLAFFAKKGSMLSVDQHTVIDRLLQAAYGLCFYLWKTVVPIRLSPLYQLHDFSITKPQYILYVAVVLGITLVLVCLRNRWPWAITAWFCYGIIVSPLLGFTQSGPQMTADRYTYFSGLPFAILVGAGVYKLALVYQEKKMRRLSWISIHFMASTVLILLAMQSYRQVRVWQDNLSFWNQIIYLDPSNTLALNERARLKFEITYDYMGAETDYSHLIILQPKNTDALVNRGLVRIKLEKFAGALQDFNLALRLDTRKAEAHNGLGLWYYEKGAPKKALKSYNTAIELDSKFADAFNNRGLAHSQLGNPTIAIKDFTAAIRLAPMSPDAYANRGVALLSLNKVEQAVQDFTKALDVAPSNWFFRKSVEQALTGAYMRQKK
ncbi:MAG: tetratricopeptide repeat protein [Desulfobacterales bacterium]|nr:MAG: tetratricopeptide repeat protein [Desulfobacterales bacterium]